MQKDKSFKTPTLRLRDDAHRVELIVPNGATRPELGTRVPGDEDRRAATIEHAGGAGPSARQPPLESIDSPLPRRTQTILTHRLPRIVQDRLNGAEPQLASARDSGGAQAEGHTLIAAPPKSES
ncbi:MAG TPA: hypothetical protein VL635_11150 [Trinickia sp.]|jgi:hypothetical protein|nr:hypothetical protein [Trinickia sp.]